MSGDTENEQDQKREGDGQTNSTELLPGGVSDNPKEDHGNDSRQAYACEEKGEHPPYAVA